MVGTLWHLQHGCHQVPTMVVDYPEAGCRMGYDDNHIGGSPQDMVEPHPGDQPAAKWTGGPHWVLALLVEKEQSPNVTLCSCLSPSLHSLLQKQKILAIPHQTLLFCCI